MTFSASTLSADGVRTFIGEQRAQRLAKEQAHEAAAALELERLRKEFADRRVKPQALELIASLIQKAVERGEREVLVIRFPSSWLPDRGRAIANQDHDWPEKLEGFAKHAHEYYETELAPRGFELRAGILEWPGGFPGDVGLFLSW